MYKLKRPNPNEAAPPLFHTLKPGEHAVYYIQLLSSQSTSKNPHPREHIHGPFASPTEAQGYCAKLKMWFPEALEEARFKITDRTGKSLSNGRQPS